MDKAEAIRIIQALANGADAESREALCFALKVLEGNPNRPENVGKSWDKTEDDLLCQRFDSGVDLKELAADHKRSRNAIRSRLVKLGKIEGIKNPASSASV